MAPMRVLKVAVSFLEMFISSCSRDKERTSIGRDILEISSFCALEDG